MVTKRKLKWLYEYQTKQAVRLNKKTIKEKETL